MDDDPPCLPVEVPVYDWLREVVQVLHALGHVDGDHQLGLQVDQPAAVDDTSLKQAAT